MEGGGEELPQAGAPRQAPLEEAHVRAPELGELLAPRLPPVKAEAEVLLALLVLEASSSSPLLDPLPLLVQLPSHHLGTCRREICLSLRLTGYLPTMRYATQQSQLLLVL